MSEDYKSKNIAGHLAEAFLNNPLTMLFAISIILLGYITLNIAPREEDPQIEVSGGSIIIMIPGASPKAITNVVVKPLERRIREIKGVEHIYGTAMNNVGMINVQYFIGEDRESSNLKLYDKVMQNMDTLPKGIGMPLVKPFDIDIDIPVITVAFYQKDASKPSTLKQYHTVREIQQEINALNNVSKSTLKGMHKPQFNIQVDIDKLSSYHLSLGQIASSVKAIATNAPNINAPTSSNSIIVFGVKNAIEDIDDLKDLIIAQYMGSPIYLKNVAKIEYGYDVQHFQNSLIAQRDNNSSFDSPVQQVTLTVSKLKGTNAVYVAQDVIDLLDERSEFFNQEGIGYIITRNYGERANEAVGELMHHLVITIGIIGLILIPFLGWRESLVVSIAVPMILAATLFIAYMTDQTINRITLFAFLLSLGLIVDDAIIVIENIHRRMHLKETQDHSFDRIIVEATDEIGPSTNIATIAIILTMVPMGFVGGMMGQFMKPIPLNVPVALAVSLFVAYVFTPFLAKKMIKRAKGTH
ncbi:efflux RND transporter permease subunit [Sulfurimonas sp.]|uniref:efflux RND transporter permease subunit n=1 Tax=Sulfurimonas sp. TaxID=2022749 RepID=UPI002B466E77|nr:efflux RND transporter permease subunit [Sulfurimonas sp.]